jgi:ABC-type phosphate/phosphonate transport system substrate-binding protein
MQAFRRYYLYALVCGAVLSFLLAGATAGNGAADRPVSLKVGYPQYAFSEVDIKDAQAALEIWTKRMIRWPFPVESKVTIYQDEESLLRALQANEVNLAIMATTTFLRIKDTLPVEPFFVPSSKGQVGEEFCLLVHRQSGITAVPQLKGRKLLYFPRCSPNSPQRVWLNELLKSNGLPGIEQFFASAQLTEGPSQAVLPVFFRKIDACYLPRQFFETMAEMNPQVGRDLQILVKSPPVVRGLLVIRTDVDPKFKEQARKDLTEMEKQPQGKQILTLLRYDRLVPYQPGYLTNIVDCVKRMDSVEGHHHNKKGP